MHSYKDDMKFIFSLPGKTNVALMALAGMQDPQLLQNQPDPRASAAVSTNLFPTLCQGDILHLDSRQRADKQNCLAERPPGSTMCLCPWITHPSAVPRHILAITSTIRNCFLLPRPKSPRLLGFDTQLSNIRLSESEAVHQL